MKAVLTKNDVTTENGKDYILVDVRFPEYSEFGTFGLMVEDKADAVLNLEAVKAAVKAKSLEIEARKVKKLDIHRQLETLFEEFDVDTGEAVNPIS